MTENLSSMAFSFIIGLDFDGTVVKHEFPEIGEEVPYCIEVLKSLQKRGCKIVLNTMRSDRPDRAYLKEAVDFLNRRGIQLYGVNENPTQKNWTDSPKVYAHLYIDDAALGVPLINDSGGKRPFVNWLEVKEIINRHYFNID